MASSNAFRAGSKYLKPFTLHFTTVTIRYAKSCCPSIAACPSHGAETFVLSCTLERTGLIALVHGWSFCRYHIFLFLAQTGQRTMLQAVELSSQTAELIPPSTQAPIQHPPCSLSPRTSPQTPIAGPLRSRCSVGAPTTTWRF